MKLLASLYRWAFSRLPIRFSIPLVVAAVAYLLFAFPWLVYQGTPRVVKQMSAYFRLGSIPLIQSGVSEVVTATTIILFFFVGALLCYGLAATAYSLWRSEPMSNVVVHGPVLPATNGDKNAEGALSHYKRIGIILAGGGAKGAYQAGALTAIYEFLEAQNAHKKVAMIAGTSIGSWNALFWLAGMVKGSNGESGLLEQWWHHVGVDSVVQPTPYLPFRQNYFLSSTPWQETFDRFFVANGAVRDRMLQHINEPDAKDSLHFYFTRSNVERARLEFTTNRTGLDHVAPYMPGGKRPRPSVAPGTWLLAQRVEDIRDAVFSSMDLPPLFRYTRMQDEFYEDGGVIDNLPIRFGTEVEQCDLLFILPLNASFETAVNTRSVLRRLSRVMEVRQGVLERNSFKMVYLFNELAALRSQTQDYLKLLQDVHEQLGALGGETAARLQPLSDRIEALPAMKGAALPLGNDGVDADTAARSLRRRNDPLHVFAICPDPELVINTTEFWKTAESGQAFRLMHKATAEELAKNDFSPTADWIGMSLVGPHGQVKYLEDF